MKGNKIFNSIICIMVMIFSLSLTCCSVNSDSSDVKNSESGNSSQKTVIKFAGRGSADEESNYNKFIAQFEKENSDITVSLQWFSDESSYSLGLQNAGKNLPDVFMMDDRDFLQYADAGRLYDISSICTQNELDSLYSAGVDKYYYNEDTLALGKSDGAGLYGLPKDQGPYVLVYNKTMFKTLADNAGYTKGFPSATEPMNFTEFSELLYKLCHGTNYYGIGAYEMQAAIYSNNASFFDNEAKTSKITDKNFTDALQFIANLNLKYGVMPAAADQASSNGYQRFTGGSSLFCFAGPWDCTAFWKDLNFDWDICPVCVGTAGGAVSTAWVGGMSYSISSNSKVKDAAVKFVKFIAMNEDSQRNQYVTGQSVPNLISMADEYINDTKSLLVNKAPEHRSVWIDTIDGIKNSNDKVTGKTRAQYYTYSSSWYSDFEEYLDQKGLWTGKSTAAAICSDYNSQFQTALNEMRENLG